MSISISIKIYVTFVGGEKRAVAYIEEIMYFKTLLWGGRGVLKNPNPSPTLSLLKNLP